MVLFFTISNTDVICLFLNERTDKGYLISSNNLISLELKYGYNWNI